MNQMILIVPVLLPILFGFAMLIYRDKTNDYHPAAMEVAVILTSLIMWGILLTGAGREGFIAFELTNDLKVFFRLDGAGMVFAGLVSLLWPLASLYAIEYMEHDPEYRRSFFALYTMTYGVTLGIALAGNLVTLYMFYEFLTVVTFPLVLHYRTRESRRAAEIYLYYSMTGAACAFVALIYVLMYGSTTDFTLGGVMGTASGENINLLLVMYVLGFFGFGVKAAVFPMHKWLPTASVAPTPVTALLHAVAVVKAGAFGIIRLTYYSYGADFLRGTWAHYLVLGFAMFTVAYASTMGVREIHFKKRLAYSTISNLSYIVMAAALMNPAGLVAALTHMIIHAITKISGFFCAGAVMHKADRNYVYELDGLGWKMPVTFISFTIVSLSLTGIPLFAGFISKWNIGQAAIADGGIAGILAFCVLLYSAAMTAIYTMTAVVRAFFPKKDSRWYQANLEEKKDLTDPTWKMLLPLIIFSILILAIGMNGQPLVDFLWNIAKGVI